MVAIDPWIRELIDPDTITIGGAIKNGIYEKFEKDNNCIFRISKSLSVNAHNLEQCDMVRVHILHRGVVVEATKDEIKKHGDVLTFHGETKYYYPCSKWKVIQGNPKWWEI